MPDIWGAGVSPPSVSVVLVTVKLGTSGRPAKGSLALIRCSLSGSVSNSYQPRRDGGNAAVPRDANRSPSRPECRADLDDDVEEPDGAECAPYPIHATGQLAIGPR